MALLAITLILISGLLHSVWNFLAKNSKNKLCFIWAIKFCSLFFLLPLIIFWCTSRWSLLLSDLDAGFFFAIVAGSGSIHFLYNYFLSKSYAHGEISLAYPIARGSAPFLVALFSFFFIGEKLSPSGIFGMILIASGVMGVSIGDLNELVDRMKGSDEHNGSSRFGNYKVFVFAGTTAVMISLYTFVDGFAAREFGVIVFMYSYSLVSTLILSIPVLQNLEKLKSEIFSNFWQIFAAGALMPASYLLALYAMRIAQLGYIASVRNVSIVFAVLIGIVKLEESYGKNKLIGSLILLAGVLAIGIG